MSQRSEKRGDAPRNAVPVTLQTWLEMNACKLLSGIAMAALSITCTAAEVTGACAPSFSEVDVTHGLNVRNRCAVPAPALARVTERLNRAVNSDGLSAAQRVALATAANVMLHAVFSQTDHSEPASDAAFANFETMLESLASQIRTRPDIDPAAEASKWSARYEDLLRRLSITHSADPTELQFDEAARRLDLDNASALLIRLIAEVPTTAELSAARNYDAANIELLRFMPWNALPYLEKAHALQPDDMDIATAYADTLLEQHEPGRAEPVYQALLIQYRMLAQQKPPTFQPSIARTLGKLGSLYLMRQQQKEAEAAWLHALEIYWALARVNPSAYSPAVARTIDSLATLYRDTQRLQDAADAWREVLALDRALARQDPVMYRPAVATTLNDLGILYSATQRTHDAELAYLEAIGIQRALAHDNPGAWRPALARTLNNLGNFYSANERLAQAEHAYREALKIRQQLARESPAIYRADLARTLGNLGVLYRLERQPAKALQADQQALQIVRALSRDTPAAYQPDEARILNNLGVLYSRTGKPREAEDAWRRALDLYRKLAQDDPSTWRQDEVRTLRNLGTLLSHMQRSAEAEELKREADDLSDSTRAQ
ncbi:tetratricopeptide repeat protein [Paraburkholderia sp.]|uniref:tetratricopeptide repeat protein n=1 Tax=Paraburkholderia sp. TaxID=1926495 RepID=UPI0025E248A6|nr:tetratricopeptide repeat protein [Paraburkholderia sp.]